MEQPQLNGGMFKPVQFGREMRDAYFNFASSYFPLNHGSFGTFPTPVRDYQRRLQEESEAKPDTFIRRTYLELLLEARAAAATLLGVATDEVVFLPNATTGINTILRNIEYHSGDTILHFSTIYGACLKTIQSLQETTPVERRCIDLQYPIEDDEILRLFKEAVLSAKEEGLSIKLAMFDTVLTSPGVRFPWELLVRLCKELGILSLIDGAHGIGHIDLTHLGKTGPDFFVSNCYKWFMVPRGCAVFHVPFRNQPLIRTTFPTSWGYENPDVRRKVPTSRYFVHLFDKISTTDNTAYLCLLEAVKFRTQVCGGEGRIQEYCQHIAQEGGWLMAKALGTDVLENDSQTLGQCCFVNVRLPLEATAAGIEVAVAPSVAKWIQETIATEYETYIPIKFYAGAFWSRISGQIYLGLPDFAWAAGVLLELCVRVKNGEWRDRHSA